MADLVENPVYETGIYQIETTDSVVGGPPDLATKQGVTNIPAQQLGNRTAYLLAELQALQTDLSNIDVSAQINAAISALVNGAPGALDTLNELAAAIGDNDNELAALLAQIAALSSQVAENSIKAWVNFNGTGVVSIRESFNVSSVTDNGTGDYTVNFATPMVDANYAAIGGISSVEVNSDDVRSQPGGQLAGSFRLITVAGATKADSSYVQLAFIR